MSDELRNLSLGEGNYAIIADLVTPNRPMFSAVPGFNIGVWERSLGEILDMDFDVAVSLHNQLPMNQAMNGCTRTQVE